MKNILIVDDEMGIRENLGSFFKKKYNVFLAEDGDMAWMMVQQHHIDFIISDMNMPNMNGDELAFKVFNYDASIPIIVLSGLDDNHDAEYPNNVYKFVEKPFKLRELIEDVKSKIGQ